MPFTLTMPKLSPTMTEGTIAKWHKKEGDKVESGDLLIEVATDKATVEHNALDEGFIRKILVKEGDEALVNQAIAVFTEKEGESIEGYQPEGVQRIEEVTTLETEVEEEGSHKEETKKIAPFSSKGGAAMPVPSFVPEAPLENYRFDHAFSSGEKLRTSPLARKIAAERKIDLTSVKGSGPRGRIVSRDLDGAQSLGRASFGTPLTPSKNPGSYHEEKLSPMRKSISQRLQEAKTFIPHFYTEQDLDAEPMVKLREQLKKNGVKISYNDFIVRACALALREHPTINSGFNSETNSIVAFETIDISIAVSVDGGLITPIVRHADYKNIGKISSEIRGLAVKAREGALKPEEYKGGSFTISNLGMYGISRFSAIINPPQAAILAVGGLREEPVVKDGVVVPGYRMACVLSADHRVIDGAASASFLGTLREIVENPAILLV